MDCHIVRRVGVLGDVGSVMVGMVASVVMVEAQQEIDCTEQTLGGVLSGYCYGAYRKMGAC
jgi:hypothetical protein